MANPTKALLEAQKFAALAKLHGFKWEVRNSVVTITRAFSPGDKDAFTDCDIVASAVLANAPLKGGSVWGTDGGSVGGHVGLTTGRFVMHKSGDGVRFLTALSKIAR